MADSVITVLGRDSLPATFVRFKAPSREDTRQGASTLIKEVMINEDICINI